MSEYKKLLKEYLAEQKPDQKWFLPPGLRLKTYFFLAHLDSAEDRPVMIVGDTGVGKSLFIHIAKKHFCNINKKSEEEVIEANCAHFGREGSDANIARAEIFGCDANIAESLRIPAKAGLLNLANNNLLILEEIGELTKDVQAMLLTFIDTGNFLMLGGTKLVESKVNIISATNRSGDSFRDDFRYRFLRFSIPPVHARRGDILYYLLKDYPHVLDELYIWEIFCLLTYNWPGNVREIRYIGFLLDRQIKLKNSGISTIGGRVKSGAFKESLLFGLASEGGEDIGIDLEKVIEFELEFYVYAKEDLQEVYETLPLFELSHRYIFKDYIPSRFGYGQNKQKLDEVTKIERIEKINFELSLFCDFFSVDIESKGNILDVINEDRKYAETSVDKYFRFRNEEGEKLFNDLNPSYVKIAEYYDLISNLNKNVVGNLGMTVKKNIWFLSEAELLAAYLKGLLIANGFNKSKIAKKFDMTTQGLDKRLKKYGIDVKTLRNKFDKINSNKIE